MFHTGHGFDETIPVWLHNTDGTISNARPTIYHRNAEQQMRQHGAKSRIGYIVENRYGDKKPMTFKQAQRMSSLLERQFLKIVDWWTAPNVPMEYALTGFDTECEGHGDSSIYRMPGANE